MGVPHEDPSRRVHGRPKQGSQEESPWAPPARIPGGGSQEDTRAPPARTPGGGSQVSPVQTPEGESISVPHKDPGRRIHGHPP